MKSRGLTGLLVAGVIGVVSSEARAADIGNAPAAPPTAEGSAPAASPAADTPKPISAPPPPGAPAERTAKNAIYVEGGGVGGVYSLNYERIFGEFAPRIGFEYWSMSVSSPGSNGTDEAHTSFVAIPMSVSYLGIGSLRNMFEVGAGATIAMVGEGGSIGGVGSASASTTMVLGTATAGYRFQPADGGFVFRGGLNAIIGLPDAPVIPWPYIALGGAF